MYPTLEHPASGIFVHEQVQALRRAGYDVRVASGSPVTLSWRRPRNLLRQCWRLLRARWSGWDAWEGVPLVRFRYPAGAFARIFTYPWFYAALLRRLLPGLAKDFPYDVVHVHTAFLDGRAGIAAARHRGVPMVLTEHTGPLEIVTRDPGMRIHTQAGVDGADRLIAVSEALRQDMLAQLRIARPERLTVLPNGVDTGFFDPDITTRCQADAQVDYADVERLLAPVAARLESGPLTGSDAAQGIRAALAQLAELARRKDSLPAGATGGQPPVNALWVGHHVEVKRVDRLLDALAIARRHEPRLVLTLVGSGPLEPAARERAQALGVAQQVRFVPAASREAVREHMAHADFFVLPSESETFGVVVIEALSMGLPVLATDCGGPADVLGDPGLGMLADNTLEGIALGLQRMVRALDGFDAGHIRATAIARYDYARLAASLGAAYQELAGGAPAQAAASSGATRTRPAAFSR